MLTYILIPSPVGELKLVASKKALVAILWDKERDNRVLLDEMEEDCSHPILLQTEKQLQEYFSGKRKTFSIPLETKGTDFQKSVWDELNKISYGKRISYRDVAVALDNSKAVRAVGSAIGRNPISIIVPCHRVVATNGTLAGFAGGLDRKQILLNLEAEYQN